MSTFTTCQVLNATQEHTFGDYDVMLDNQVKVIIMHPRLLWKIQDADETVKINHVGGHLFTVSQTGYLDPLFCVIVTYNPQKLHNHPS